MGLKTMTVAVETCDRCGRVVRNIEVGSGEMPQAKKSVSLRVAKTISDDGEEKVDELSYGVLCPACAAVVSNLIEKMKPVERKRRKKKESVSIVREAKTHSKSEEIASRGPERGLSEKDATAK